MHSIFLFILISPTIIQAASVGYIGLPALKEKISEVKTHVDKTKTYLKGGEYYPARSRRMIASSCLLLGAGLVPLIFANPSSPQSRFIGPLAQLIAKPIVTYSLIALGWFGSMLAARLFFPYPSHQELNKRLNRFSQKHVDPLIGYMDDFKIQLEMQDKEVESHLGQLKDHQDKIEQQRGQLSSLQEQHDEQGSVLRKANAGLVANQQVIAGLMLEIDELKEIIKNSKQKRSKLAIDPKKDIIKIEPHPTDHDEKIRANEIASLPSNLNVNFILENIKKIQQEDENLEKELTSLIKHENEQFSDNNNETRPVSPNGAMYRRIINRLQQNKKMVQEIQQTIDQSSKTVEL